jgi:quinolinate synthase
MTNKELVTKINELKKEKNAIILAHNYQVMEVQEIADFVGDSLQLAKEAAKVDAEIILFAGVKFMAETAKLLSPKSKVLLSRGDAGCPMADMITGEQLRQFKEAHPLGKVMCYVNSSVEVKAESDICCTSSSAIKIARSLPEDQLILFVPDQNLGTYTQKHTGRRVLCWQGYCNVHNNFLSAEDVKIAREKYPDYTLIVHPECKPEVFEKADFVASTKGMADYVAEHDNVIIGTEVGLVKQLQAKYPEKNLIPLSEKTICVNMKRTTLQDIYDTLNQDANEIIIDDAIAQKALKSVNAMLELTK